MVDLKDIGVTFISWFSKLMMIFGGTIAYIPQYAQIQREADASGFSLYICLVLVVANILRIVYWFGERFDQTLLLQSIVMLLVMYIMLELCVRMRRSRSQHSFFDFDLQHFWIYSNLSSYVVASLVFAAIASAFYNLFGHHRIVVDAIGFTSLTIEASVALPQLLKNYNSRSTRGLNSSMVILWACGDTFKLTYALMQGNPLPFILCALIQLSIDLIIFAQMFYYEDGPNP